ncbi:hypothetical protein CLV76_1418 [Marivita geojedonensis]|nr:hypothetical protein CLV76_1418 [Marivita geojedonensis]
MMTTTNNAPKTAPFFRLPILSRRKGSEGKVSYHPSQFFLT